MSAKLHSRPNLDHLRSQAKALLAALQHGDEAAARTLREHLPAATGMTPAQIRAGGFRLADAQSAIARQNGCAAWPKVARHVEQLRSLEGEWRFERLEVDGSGVPPAMLVQSRILIDGDRFRTESPEATYEGVFNIGVDAEPHEIDIDFVAGPEAGRRNMGIFRVAGESSDLLEICLDMSGSSRPKEFRTKPGSGHACELLRRVSSARPASVTGGAPPAKAPSPERSARAEDFAFVASETLKRLQGEWSCTRLTMDGREMPSMILKTAKRVAQGNTLRVSVGGQTVVDALVRVNERASPIEVDYLCVGGPAKGQVQRGILEWRGDEACFCMGGPSQARPESFESPAGGGRALSQWKH